MSRYVAQKQVTPNTKVDVHEKDGRNYTIGKWFGYWNPDRGTFNLYPNKHERCFWPGGKIPEGKIVISDRMVYVKERDLSERPLRRAAG